MEAETYQYSGWVTLGLGLFVALNLAIGTLASKQGSGTDGYLAAGRNVGLILGAGTMFATWFGVSTPIGYAGNAYVYGNQGLIADPWGAILFLVLLGAIFAAPIRRTKYLTAIDLFASRYSRGVALFSTLFLAASDLGWLSAMLVAGGSLIEFFTGLPLLVGIAIATTALTIYTYLGGIWAVTLTDALQSAFCIIGVVVVLAVLLPLVGWDTVFAEGATHNVMHLKHWEFWPTSEAAADPEFHNAGFLHYRGITGWLYWLASLAIIGIGSLPAQSVLQRVSIMKDERTARYAILLAAGLYSIFGVIPVLIGTIYYLLEPGLSLDDAFTRIPVLVVVQYLPPWIGVFFVVAMVAALMSSADSVILASASVLGYSSYKLLNPNASDEQLLRVTRAIVPLIAIIALIVALYFNAIYNLMVASGTVIFVCLCAPFVAALFWKRANAWGALASIIGGAIAWGAAYFLYLPVTTAVNTNALPGIEGVYAEGAHWDAVYISSLWGFFASVVSLVLVSVLTQEIDKPRPLVDADGQPL